MQPVKHPDADIRIALAVPEPSAHKAVAAFTGVGLIIRSAGA